MGLMGLMGLMLIVLVVSGRCEGLIIFGRGLWPRFGQFLEAGIGLADFVEAGLGCAQLFLEAAKLGLVAAEFGQGVDGFEQALLVVFGELLGLPLQELYGSRGIIAFGELGHEVDIAPEVAVLLVGMVEGAASVDLDLGYFHGGYVILAGCWPVAWQ